MPPEDIIYRPIGVIHTPLKNQKGSPIQSAVSGGIRGWVEVFPPYVPGLKDLEGFSHIILVYHFHRSEGWNAEVRPYLDEEIRGVFATRAPRRPNPIGISVVRLLEREESVLHVGGVDMLDGSPLLDIKPYVPHFDVWEVEGIGWLEGRIKGLPGKKDDGRFTV
ncbi:MAG: tRNA (N6-threonylcarbamoyladenosine(37)-N6)-methyltransferase TrmO [Thermoplasmata archaeon]|nr:tRNA (N6-threonylcarbamoyladenosine(37)-N6)-methyltransferase TrmO [Thermoplasmata archaeon]